MHAPRSRNSAGPDAHTNLSATGTDLACQPDRLLPTLQARGFDLDSLPMAASIHHPHFDAELPSVGDHDLVIPLGAIWSVYDRIALGSWIDRELALLRDLDRAGVPVLGVCFGGQAAVVAQVAAHELGAAAYAIKAAPAAAGECDGDRARPARVPLAARTAPA